jgi:DNA mismatch repair protein MutS
VGQAQRAADAARPHGDALRHVADVERITARTALRQVRPRELAGLRQTLALLPRIATVAPRGTPRPITDRLYTTVVTAMKQPETQELMLRAGADPASSTPAEFAALIRDEWNRFKAAIAAAKLSIE